MGNTDIFERMANGYDTPERIEMAKRTSEAIRQHLIDAHSKRAVDFGCGTGLVGMNLLNEFNSMIFLDTSQNMLNQIKQKLEGFNIQNVETLCFDLEKESISELHADYIFMSQVLLHIDDIETVLSRLYDALNSGGHLIIVDFDKNENIVSDMVHNGFEQEALRALMIKMGYKEVQSKTFYKGSKIFMNQDASLFVLDCKK